MRIVNFSDGASSETTPTIGNIVASSLVTYPDDATYEATEQGAPAEGNTYFNTTDKTERYYNGTIWQEKIDENTIQAVENKAIDADTNMITNIDNNEIKALAGIDATKIADGSVSNTEFQHINTVSSNVQDQIDAKQSLSEKSAANGYASLDATGKVPAIELPSYVDDVEEYADLASFPATGETGKIYIALDTNLTYRWTGTVYVEVGPSGGIDWSDPVNADIIPDGAGRDLGSLAQPFDQAHIDTVNFENGALNTGTNVVSVSGPRIRSTALDTPITVETPNDSAVNADSSGDVYILSGNKTAGTGDSGDITSQTGTSVGGTRGKIRHKDGSEGTVGEVWTSTDATGSGEWQTIAAGQPSVVTKTADYTLLLTDNNILADSTSGDITLTMPTAVGNAGKTYIITRVDGSANAVILDGDGTETIGGSLTQSQYLNSASESTELYSDGANWVITFKGIAQLDREEDMTGSSNFTAGTAKFSRNGKMVTVTIDSATFASTTIASTAVGFIPTSFRPLITVYNLSLYVGSTSLQMLEVRADGLLRITSRNFSGGGAAITSATGLTISFVI